MPADLDYHLYDCAPDAAQRFLLDIALGDQAMADKWQQWQGLCELDDIDAPSFRLLPLVYRQLSGEGVDDAELRRLRIVHRHSWYRNQNHLHHLRQALPCLQEAGIPIMFLKGLVVAERLYPDAASRYMNDVDILVQRADFVPASALLLEHGWNCIDRTPARLCWYHRQKFKHAAGFTHKQAELDLHSQRFRFINEDEDRLWSRSRTHHWHGLEVQTPGDSDLLFHCCVHGTRWSFGKLSWIVDAMLLLRRSQTSIDWEYLTSEAVRTRTVLYLLNALAYLRAAYDAPVPQAVIDRLRRQDVSATERAEYRVLATRASRGFSHQARRVALQASRYTQMDPVGRSLHLSPLGWIRFLWVHAGLPARAEPPLADH